jgi:hypothetical protein
MKLDGLSSETQALLRQLGAPEERGVARQTIS